MKEAAAVISRQNEANERAAKRARENISNALVNIIH